MISTSEAARMLSVSQSRVLELIKNGQLVADKLSGVWLVDEDSVYERLQTVSKRGGRPPRGQGKDDARFTLMNRTHEIANLVYNRARREFTFIDASIDASRAPIGLGQDPSQIPLFEFERWWRGRGIPQARNGIDQVLRQAGVEVPEELLQRNLGLSLSDQYWIRPEGSGLRWEDVNFFNNEFEEVSIRTEPYALGGGRAHPDNTSDGNLSKFWIIRDGVRILKKSGRHNGQEPYNEVVATALCRRLLAEGEYVEYTLEGKGSSAWSLCANFLTDEEEYVPAMYVERLEEQSPVNNDFDHYIECCNRLGANGVRSALERMIVCDDIMANNDRHHRNFGIVRNVETLECRPVPIFDSGSSLWCDIDTETLSKGESGFTSKQFEPSPARQLLLVEDFSWFDISHMNGFVDEAMDILSANDALQERLPYIRRSLEQRVDRMIDIVEWS